MARDFQTNVIIGGKINPNLKKVFDVAGKYASKTADIITKTNSKVEASMHKLQTKASNVAKTAKKAAVVGTAISGAALLGGKAMLDQAGNMEQYRNTLNTVMKDQQKAAEMFRWAVGFANSTPYETDEVVEATVKLQAYGLEAKKVLPLIGDMASAMGKSMDQGVEAIADAQTGELERLKEFGIKKEQIVQQAAKTMKGVEIVNSKGQITNQKAFNAALLSLMKERYEGGMKTQAKSMKGLMSTITGVAKSGLAEIAGISSSGDIINGSMFDVVKGKIGSLADALTKMQTDGTFQKLQTGLANFTSKAIDGIESLLPKVANFTQYIIDNGPEILSKVELIGKAFIGWKVISGFTSGIQTLLALGDALSIIRTRYLGVAGAKAIDKAETLYLQGLYAKDAIVMGAKTISTWAMTAAQTAWNATMTIGTIVGKAFGAVLAFLTSPIGLVILAITALIGIGYLLYKNWDTISKALVGIWQNYVLPAFQSIGSFFSGIFDGVVAIFKGYVNIWIGIANFLIGSLNKIKFTAPDWVPGIGGKTLGVNIPMIPTFAKGGFANGPSIFGEAGLEAAIPIKPKNPRSISLLNQTAKMLGVSPGGEGGPKTFVYAPSIGAGASPETIQALRDNFEEFKAYIEQYFHDEGRLSFE